jgi:hypothetical protein
MKSTPLLHAMRLEKVQTRVDINKLKFFIRLVNNPVTCDIILQQLKDVQSSFVQLERGKWATHVVEILQVFQRNKPDLYNELTDSLNCTLLFDPDSTGAQPQTKLERLTLAELTEHVVSLSKEIHGLNTRQYKSGMSDTVRFLLYGNNKQSFTLLKQYLKTYTTPD